MAGLHEKEGCHWLVMSAMVTCWGSCTLPPTSCYDFASFDSGKAVCTQELADERVSMEEVT